MLLRMIATVITLATVIAISIAETCEEKCSREAEMVSLKHDNDLLRKEFECASKLNEHEQKCNHNQHVCERSIHAHELKSAVTISSTQHECEKAISAKQHECETTLAYIQYNMTNLQAELKRLESVMKNYGFFDHQLGAFEALWKNIKNLLPFHEIP